LFSLSLNNRGIWLLVLLAVFGLSSYVMAREQRLSPLGACEKPAIADNLVNCDGEGQRVTDLFVLFGNKLNINKASARDLALIPKLRKSVAQAIVEQREELGRFSSYQQVDDVKGVGPKTLESIKLHTTLN
jgi:competence protein ComEA